MTMVANSNHDSLRQQLQAGADALALGLSDAQVGLLMDFLALLQKWNKVYNLTAVRDPAEMLTHHLLDSLAVIRPLRRQLGLTEGVPVLPERTFRLLDVGAGAGLPGVVIAIGCPEVEVSCVDAVGKKAAFIRQVAATLKLPNLCSLHARVETLTTADWDVVSSRAFASLADFVAGSAAALRPSAGEGASPSAGVWMAMKGKHPGEELAALPSATEVFHVEPLTVPGLDAERCIVWMRKKQG